MATIDLTEKLKEIKAQMEKDAPTYYRRVLSEEIVPGLPLEIYQNEANASDVWLSPRSVCEALGLGRNWLNTSYPRPGTMAKLVRLGFNPEKRYISVRAGGNLSTPSLAIDRADFHALMAYAAGLGKQQAIDLRRAFMLLGLVGVAGLAKGAEETRAAFASLYSQLKAEAEDVSK